MSRARSALAWELAEQDGRDFLTESDHARAARILAAVHAKHPAMAPAFGSDNGVSAQYRDSEIMRLVIAACMKENIWILVVHDEAIVPARYASRVAAIMVRIFEEREPGPNSPLLKVTSRLEIQTGETSNQKVTIRGRTPLFLHFVGPSCKKLKQHNGIAYRGSNE